MLLLYLQKNIPVVQKSNKFFNTLRPSSTCQRE